MNRPIASRQRGIALLVLLGILAIGASWFLVSKLDALSANFAARDRNSNAAVLNRAKQALIGYVAAQAMKPLENNPGSLPCPENPGDFNDPLGLGFDGRAGSGCGSSVKVGRFPWRTIGTEKLIDASGEPLWYVVSTNWGVPTGLNSNINSNSVGQLTVDGVPNAVIALIIAPGSAFAVPAAAGCTAWNQARPVVGPPDWRNYLECDNATSPADASFMTTGPAGSFNDQVIRVTVADVMPAIEAAIANRIEREIVPVLKSVYGDTTWGTSSTNPAFPFAAPFANPTTSSYLGQISLYQGLLPFNYHSGSCGGNVRCSTDAITWNAVPSLSSSGGPGYLTSTQTCYMSGSTPTCEGYYYGGALNISMSDALTTQITNGLRTFTLAGHTGTFEPWRWTEPSGPWVNLGTQPATVSRSLVSNGTARFVAGAALPSVPTWGYYYIYGSRPTISDHSILSSTNPTTGWFVRNEWYRLVYYAIAPSYAAGGSLSCTTGGTCLSVANGDPTRPIAPVGGQRAILILAGSRVVGQTPPSAARADYFEFGNATGAFERQPIKRSQVINVAQKIPFNDRIIVVDSN